MSFTVIVLVGYYNIYIYENLENSIGSIMVKRLRPGSSKAVSGGHGDQVHSGEKAMSRGLGMAASLID